MIPIYLYCFSPIAIIYHDDIDFFARKPALDILAFLHVVIDITLIAVLCDKHRFLFESIGSIKPAYILIPMYCVVLLNSKNLFIVGLNVSRLSLIHFVLRTVKGHQSFFFDSYYQIRIFFVIATHIMDNLSRLED